MVPDSAQKLSQFIRQRTRLPADPQPADQVVSEEDLESFRLEVTAGKKLRFDGVYHPASGRRLRGEQSHPSRMQTCATSPGMALATTSTPLLYLEERRSPKARLKKNPSLVASLFLHLIVLLGLTFFTFTTFEQQVDFTLSIEPETFPQEEIDLQEVVIEPLEVIDSDMDRLASELQEASKVSANELSSEVALADLTNVSGSTKLGLGDLSGLFGTHGNALTEVLPTREKLTATFFETKVEGRRIVYVVDNSGGMRSGELETLIDELMKSVESLSEKQEFYVIFYSDALYPLFYPDPVQRFVPANDRSKQQLESWLETVEFCVGNVVDSAIEAATLIRPDVVYLLTDGNLDQTSDQRRLAFLLNPQGRRFPIHTFGMGTGEKGKAAQKLRQVAEANGGTFRAVKVSAAAKNAALEKNRPYHDKEPGKVWGRNVGSGWGRK